MSALITSAGEIVTGALDWVVEVVGVVNANPLLLLFTILPLVGLGIGLFRRIINVQ